MWLENFRKCMKKKKKTTFFSTLNGSIDFPRPHQSVGFDRIAAWKQNNLHMDL